MKAIATRLHASRILARGAGVCICTALIAMTPARASAEIVCSHFTVYRTITVLGVVVWEGVYEEGTICRES